MGPFLKSVCTGLKAKHIKKRSNQRGGRRQNETFPLHLALSMIFSANSFPVDLKRNSAIRANDKKKQH